MCTVPEKCNIYTKFCNEPDPWMSVKKRERESRGEGRAITHCGVIALPYTPPCVLFGFSIFPFYPQIHLILSYGFHKMLPLDRKHRKGPVKLPLTWIPLSQLLSESQNCSACIKLTIVTCSVRELTQSQHTSGSFPGRATLTILSCEGSSPLSFLCHQIRWASRYPLVLLPETFVHPN